MRSIALAGLVSLAMAIPAAAQAFYPESPRGDAALTYQWVRSNTQPGDCGCFNLNGGGVSASLNLRPTFAAVAEISAGHAGNGPSTGNSLTLISYMAGARLLAPQSWQHSRHSLQPFAQVLAGAAHAGGGIAGAGDSSTAFAGRVGGGVDLPVTPHLAVRLVQVDYYATRFANGVNDHQNNLLLGAGLV